MINDRTSIPILNKCISRLGLQQLSLVFPLLSLSCCSICSCCGNLDLSKRRRPNIEGVPTACMCILRDHSVDDALHSSYAHCSSYALHSSYAHCSERFDIISDGLTNNSAVKLLGLDATLLAEMRSLRKAELGHLLWYNASSAMTMFIQV